MWWQVHWCFTTIKFSPLGNFFFLRKTFLLFWSANITAMKPLYSANFVSQLLLVSGGWGLSSSFSPSWLHFPGGQKMLSAGNLYKHSLCEKGYKKWFGIISCLWVSTPVKQLGCQRGIERNLQSYYYLCSLRAGSLQGKKGEEPSFLSPQRACLQATICGIQLHVPVSIASMI